MAYGGPWDERTEKFLCCKTSKKIMASFPFLSFAPLGERSNPNALVRPGVADIVGWARRREREKTGVVRDFVSRGRIFRKPERRGIR